MKGRTAQQPALLDCIPDSLNTVHREPYQVETLKLTEVSVQLLRRKLEENN